jgi:uncharacterized protein YdeI (YjbR/CyaY-like superfamily)
MAPVTPDPKRIRGFRDAAAFEKWLSSHHDRETELWLKIHKKASGLPTVTYAEALDVALCWGWIDGLKKSFDDDSFLQRFTPRRPRSVWSQVNRQHVDRLVRAGRMTTHGLKHVEAARADGRWDAAYAPIRAASPASIPDDLRAAIDANARARRAFATLGRMELFALAFRTNNMKTTDGRARKIAELVERLATNGTLARDRPEDAGRGAVKRTTRAARTSARRATSSRRKTKA